MRRCCLLQRPRRGQAAGLLGLVFTQARSRRGARPPRGAARADGAQRLPARRHHRGAGRHGLRLRLHGRPAGRGHGLHHHRAQVQPPRHHARRHGGLRRPPAHTGRTTQVWDAVVTHRESGRTLALFRCTQMCCTHADGAAPSVYASRLAGAARGARHRPRGRAGGRAGCCHPAEEVCGFGAIGWWRSRVSRAPRRRWARWPAMRPWAHGPPPRWACRACSCCRDTALVKPARHPARGLAPGLGLPRLLDRPQVITLRVALTPCTAASGCMRVLDGSHRWGHVSENRTLRWNAIEDELNDLPPALRERAASSEHLLELAPAT